MIRLLKISRNNKGEYHELVRSYELRPVNLFNLTEKQAAGVLDHFIQFLKSLNERIVFRIVEDERKLNAGGEEYIIPYKRYFVSSHLDIGTVLPFLGTRFARAESIAELKPISATSRYFHDSEGYVARIYNVTRLGGAAHPGFLTSVYPVAHEVRVEILPLDPDQAKKEARSHTLSMGSKVVIRQSEGRYVDPEDQVEFQRAQQSAELVAAGQEKLVKMKVVIVLRGKTKADVQEKEVRLRQTLRGLVGEVDSPRWLQLSLYQDRGPEWARGRHFFLPTSSAATFFPFAGLDVVDHDGVFVGQNLQTSNAILYDIFEKENYNVALMGESGFGKSTLIKTLMSRMLSQNEGMAMFVFDSIVRPEYAVGPDGSYENSFAGLTKSVVHRFREDEGAGLDPFKVFGDGRRAARFIASITGVEEEPDLLADLYIAAQKSGSVGELVSNAQEPLLKRLKANLPPYRFLFEGEMKVYNKTVFVLNDIQNPELRDAAAFLTFSAIWRLVKDKMPVSMRKAIVVDEGWSLVEKNPRTGKPYFPLAVEYVPEIARTGRHYNTCFLIATQLVSDFMGRAGEYGPGRPMVESCATKIILKQDYAAAPVLTEALSLSGEEEKFILNADVGKGILATQEGKLFFYNMLSETERKLFTTRPNEVAT
jgi:energy-coupling factor transporter ATP-binding protein EcfA2